MSPGEWAWSPDHAQLCEVVETPTLWGETTYRAWLPGSDSAVRIEASRLTQAYPEMAPLLMIRVEGHGHE